MPTIIDLASLGSAGFVVVGDHPEQFAGQSVSNAGDVNGDGFDDLIVGTDAGSAYVVFGQAGGFGTAELGNLGSDGFLIQGVPNEIYGFTVSSAGDVNGDGFDDLIVGGMAPYYGFYYGGAYSTAYVIFGHSGSFGTVTVDNLNASTGFKIVGPWGYSYTPLSVSSAGDVNGDGFDDIIVGDPYGFGGSGVSFVVFGQASGFETIQLLNLQAGDGFRISGTPESYDFAGFSVSGAGDINGDGFDDLIVGAPYGDNGGLYAGEAYVIFGRASGFSNITLSGLASSAGFVIQGDATEDNAGFSVSAAGDFNGDGYDDIVIGAPFGNSGNPDSGQAYLLFGRANGFPNLDLSSLAASAGFMIQGDDTGDHAGWSVAAAGDVNGDGYDDIVIGAPGNDTLRGGAQRTIDAGEAYVIFGRASGFGTIDLTTLSTADGFIIQGEFADDLAGFSVSAAGDVDNDGFDDLIIGAPGADRGGTNSGASYIISGRLHFNTEARNDFNGDGRSDILWRNDNGGVANWLGQTNGSFVGNLGNSYNAMPHNWQVAGVGDFNGDGRDDILWRHDNGDVADWLGQANGGFSGNYANSYNAVANSWHVAGVGDFNGDGRDDVLWRHDNGNVANWLGQANGGFAGNYAASYNPAAGDWHIISVGDFNGDGRDDILWRHDNGNVSNWLGLANGGFIGNYAASYNPLANSWHAAGAGDFNGDGRDDVLWRNDNGAIVNWLGRADGGFAGNLGNSYSAVPTDWHLFEIGDFNGDGRDDLLWRSANGDVIVRLAQANGSYVAGPVASVAIDNSWHVQDPALNLV